jgi:hypothetical protein
MTSANQVINKHCLVTYRHCNLSIHTGYLLDSALKCWNHQHVRNYFPELPKTERVLLVSLQTKLKSNFIWQTDVVGAVSCDIVSNIANSDKFPISP